MRAGRWLPLAFTALLGLAGCGVPEDESGGGGRVLVAVAANFSRTHAELSRRFEAGTGVRVEASVGSTGQLYAQIANGAPFDIFLAADRLRPRLLEEAALILPGTRFTYATGRLALFGPGLDPVRAGGLDLTDPRVVNVALASPRSAPYGAAAAAVVDRLGLASLLAPRLVRGESVSQVLQFVRSGAAELGFVALSQVIDEPAGSYWIVPGAYHPPLDQDGVLLPAAAGNAAARDYFGFLRSDEAREVIRSSGYGVPAGLP